MNASELKHHYEINNPKGHFFTRNNMKFAGDTMKNYGVRDTGSNWELYRRCPVKHGLNSSAYFDKVTFKQVYI